MCFAVWDIAFAITVAIVKVTNVGPNIFYNCRNQISLGGQEEKQKVHFFLQSNGTNYSRMVQVKKWKTSF